MAAPGPGRPPVISRELFEQLRAYLGFRHVYRHSYTFQLKWSKMQPLVVGIGDILRDLESSVKDLPADT